MTLILRGRALITRIYTYRFVQSNSDFIRRDYLLKWSRLSDSERKRTFGDYSIRMDTKKARYTYTDYFTANHMPLVLEKLVGIDASDINQTEPKLGSVQIRLTELGVGSVRITCGILFDSISVEDVIELTLRPETKRMMEDYAERFWTDVLEGVNSLVGVKTKLSKLDEYLIFRCSDLVIGETPAIDVSDAFKVRRELSVSDKKQLAGLAIMSYLWSNYDESFVEEYLSKDLSTTNKEFQFIEWRNAFFYHHHDITRIEKPAPFFDYLYDLLLGLEILLIFRSSLRSVDQNLETNLRRIEELFKSRIRGLSILLRELKTMHSQMLAVSFLRDLGKDVLVDHFNRFIIRAYDEMMINTLIAAIENKTGIIERAVTTRFNLLMALLMAVLTIAATLIAVFTLVLR